jgi:hypothetical protein
MTAWIRNKFASWIRICMKMWIRIKLCSRSQKPRLFFKQIITTIDMERRMWHNLLNIRGTDSAGCSPGCLVFTFYFSKRSWTLSLIWICIEIFAWIRIRKKPTQIRNTVMSKDPDPALRSNFRRVGIRKKRMRIQALLNRVRYQLWRSGSAPDLKKVSDRHG